MADKRSQEQLGHGTGLGGRQRLVWRSGDDVVWCGCAGWIRSTRRPRTCTHINDLVEQAVIPDTYAMTEDEVRAEARLLRLADPSPDVVREAIRDAFDVKPAVVKPGSAPVFAPPAALPVQDPDELTAWAAKAFALLRKAGVSCQMAPITPERLVEWSLPRKFSGYAGFMPGQLSTAKHRATHGLALYFGVLDGRTQASEVCRLIMEAFRFVGGFSASIATNTPEGEELGDAVVSRKPHGPAQG